MVDHPYYRPALKSDLERSPTEPPPPDTDPGSTDAVHEPAHYARLEPQPKVVILAWRLPWALGNALKYIARAGHKGDAIEDLEKARECLAIEIAWLREERRNG